MDFSEDIETGQTAYSDDEHLGEYENEMYNMFGDMEISNEIPNEYQFEEDKSGDEDGVLDNSDNELPNVSPLKPRQKAKKFLSPCKSYKRKSRRGLNKSPSESKKEHSINLTQSDSENEVFLNLTHLSSLSTCNTTPSDDHLTYDSEPINSDTASHISDLSLSTNRQKPKKFEKVKLDEACMACAPVDMVEEIPWGIDGDHIYKIKCSEDEWLSKYEDGRYFFLKDSSRRDLVGKRKFGKCLGSFICKCGDCPKLTSEDVVNTIDFRRIDKDQYVRA